MKIHSRLAGLISFSARAGVGHFCSVRARLDLAKTNQVICDRSALWLEIGRKFRGSAIRNRRAFVRLSLRQRRIRSVKKKYY